MKWETGRQGGGYKKFSIFESKKFKFDCLLLKYPYGSFIGWHKDPAPEGYKHYRLNIVMKKAVGGEFKTWDYTSHESRRSPRIVLFRPDMELHCVTQVLAGTRYVFSIGWLRKKKI